MKGNNEIETRVGGKGFLGAVLSSERKREQISFCRLRF